MSALCSTCVHPSELISQQRDVKSLWDQGLVKHHSVILPFPGSKTKYVCSLLALHPKKREFYSKGSSFLAEMIEN